MAALRMPCLVLVLGLVMAHPAISQAVPVDSHVNYGQPVNMRDVHFRAERGEVAAQLQLGLAYLNGDGVEAPDGYKALHWFKLAADQGDERAQKEYRDLKPRLDAFLALRAKALTGDAAAEVEYGLALYDVRTSATLFDHTTNPHNWFRRAADQGNADGIYEVAYDQYRAWVKHGRGEDDPEFEEDPLTGNLEAALAGFNKAAAQQQQGAYAMLARLYGLDTPHHDEALARQWLEAAAPSSEDAEGALCRLEYDGEIDSYGFNVENMAYHVSGPVDDGKAFACFSRHVDRSDASAAESYWYLGDMYHLGRGTPPDDSKAVPLLNKAVASFAFASGAGHVGVANLDLARIYNSSPTVPHDLVSAYGFYNAALKSFYGNRDCGPPTELNPATQANADAALREQAAVRKRMTASQRNALPPQQTNLPLPACPPPVP